METVLAASTVAYRPYSLQDALRGIRDAGFRYVELGAIPGLCEHVSVNSSADAITQLRQTLSDYGLEVSSISGHSDLTTLEGVEHAHKAIDLARRLGVQILNTAVGGHAGHEEDERAFRSNIGELADHADRTGVVVALEVHGDIMANGELSAQLVQSIGRDSVRINYDTANCVFYSDTWPYEDLERALPWLAHVHLKDTMGGKGVWNFPAIGAGVVDFGRVLGILRSGGYTGPLSVEVEFTDKGCPPLNEVNAAMAVSYQTLWRLTRSDATGAKR